MKTIPLLASALLLLMACSKQNTPPAPTPTPPEPIPVPVPAMSPGYYVSSTGDDGNPGSQEKPFRTIQRVNSIDLEPGEGIYFEGGKIFKGTLMLDTNDSGLEGKPVFIGSYGTGTATINGDSTTAIYIRTNHFRLANINAKGAGRKTGNTTDGILVDSSSNGTIDSLHIEGFQKSGLLVYNCTNIRINKVTATDNGFCGIYVSGMYYRNGTHLLPGQRLSRNITLTNSIAFNNPGDPTNLTSHSGNGIIISSTDKALVDRCLSAGNGADMPHDKTGPIGLWATSSDSVVIQYSISHSNKSGFLDGGGFALDGGVSNSVIQYCLAYNNKAAGFGLYQYKGASNWYNNTLRYCISVNDATHTYYGALGIWNGPNIADQFINARVHNNVFYNTTSALVSYLYTSNNKNFRYNNNIFMGTGPVIKGTMKDDRFTGNVYWNIPGKTISMGGYATVEEWANATGQEKLEGVMTGIQVDPKFKNPITPDLTDPYQLNTLTGFHLDPASPLKNKGIDLQKIFGITLPATDFYGNMLFKGTSPEPGIHEMAD